MLSVPRTGTSKDWTHHQAGLQQCATLCNQIIRLAADPAPVPIKRRVGACQDGSLRWIWPGQADTSTGPTSLDSTHKNDIQAQIPVHLVAMLNEVLKCIFVSPASRCNSFYANDYRPPFVKTH